jgi:succinate dehydrogenase / fumarate reductase cytochrome b subunit
MSALAIPTPLNHVYRFYQTTVGKKAIMAVTGLILFSFVIGHLAGNLQVFEGREKMDAYGVFLRSLPAALYAARIVLIISVTLHIVTTVQLARLKQTARPIGYVKKNNAAGSYASRTMYWSGPIIAAFVIYHLAQFTYRVTDTRFIEGRIYDNLVITFQQPYISILYIIAMVLLGFHLSHGFWSMFQSLGIVSPAYSPYIKLLAQALAIIITVGFISIPICVLAGVVHL